MSLGRCLGAVFLASLASVVQAQEQIMPEQFLDQAQGRTLTYSLYSNGQIVGIEQFLNRTTSVWRDQNGRCTYGTIVQDGALMCFVYDDDPDPGNCWASYVKDDQFLVMSVRTKQVQVIAAITDESLGCPEQPMS